MNFKIKAFNMKSIKNDIRVDLAVILIGLAKSNELEGIKISCDEDLQFTVESSSYLMNPPEEDFEPKAFVNLTGLPPLNGSEHEDMLNYFNISCHLVNKLLSDLA
jgi:hypothetical protein